MYLKILMTINYHNHFSGMYFETYAETLARFPTTLLGSYKTRRYYYNTHREEYFFDRNRLAFDAVLFYYQSGGILACPPGVGEDIFTEELAFFQIKDTRVGKRNEDIENARKFIAGDELPKPVGGVQAFVWELFYNPSSSWCAGECSVIYLIHFIILFTRDFYEKSNGSMFIGNFFQIINCT